MQDGGLMIGDGYGVEVGLWWNASRVTKRCFVEDRTLAFCYFSEQE